MYEKFFLGTLAVLVFSLRADQATAPKISSFQETLQPKVSISIIENNSLIGRNPTSEGVEIENILKCLAWEESRDNPKAYNPRDTDGRPKFGIYQFDSITFQEWCVLKYNLKNDIWDAEIQKICVYKMIFEDNQGWQWGAFKKCIKL